jgi:hypothetical protein
MPKRQRARAERRGREAGGVEDPTTNEADVGLVDFGQFYLGIARRSYEALLKLRGRPKIAHITKKGELAPESSHYRHAVTCIVFSAFAVEHELMRLVACRIVLQSGDDRHRRLLLGAWPRRPRIDDMLRFVESASQIDPELLKGVRGLFHDRNRIVHAGIKMARKSRRGRPPTWEAKVDMPNLKPGIVEITKRDIQIAGAAIGALRNALVEEEWRTFRSRAKPRG